MRREQIATTLAVSVTCLGTLTAHAAASQNLLAGVDRYIEQARTEWGNVGVAVAVVQGDKVIYAKGFGAREFGKPARIDADTLFQVGSTSKAFTTAALGILVDEGKIQWDDPVVRHLRGFELQDPWLSRHLSIRDTVTHRSGISDSYYFALGIMSPQEAVEQLRYVTPEAPFRDSFRYSNLMYGVAGQVIESASGLTWREFVKQRLLRPLKMTRSGASPYDFWDATRVTAAFLGSAPAGVVSATQARDANVAMPNTWDENGAVLELPWQSYDAAAAAGSIVSSARDMANWVILHLNNGRFEGAQLIQEKTMRELHAAQNLYSGDDDFPFEADSETYAMGWRKAEYRGHSHLAHTGGIVGFPAYVALMPEQKLGVVVLSNGPKPVLDRYTLHKAIAFWIFDRLLRAPPRDWKGEFLAQAREVRQKLQDQESKLRQSQLRDAPPSLPLERYAGVYEDENGHSGRISVKLEGIQLVLAFAGAGAFTAQLQPWSHDIFRLRAGPAPDDVLATDMYASQFVTFRLDPAANLVSMEAFGATLRRVPDRAIDVPGP